MDKCNARVRSYKNGMTFDQCRALAESLNPGFKKHIDEHKLIRWTEILEKVDHDEIVYKLTLKFLRRDGYDIGNHKVPEVKKFTL